MCVLHLYILGVLLVRLCYCSDDDEFEDLDNANLQCRDNDNKPVDWWFIYKPPGDVFPFQLGYNFSFVTPSTVGSWYASNVGIGRNSMLINTVLPMYKRTYMDHVAVTVYQNRYFGGTSQTIARGILMADEVGGLLLTHTVPGFPNIHANRPFFPPEEAANGHLLACVSLDFEDINKVAQALRKIFPNFIYVKIPESLRERLPEWSFENSTPDVKSSRKMTDLEFKIGSKSNMALLARPPGNRACLYRTFAEKQQIYLNVYGQSRSEYLTTVCSENFGVRNIDKISLKYPDVVHYIINCTDRTWFAVSNAAPWQQKGAGPTQYWTCTSSVDKEDLSGVGALLLCIQDYGIWRTFDNLKVKEPQC